MEVAPKFPLGVIRLSDLSATLSIFPVSVSSLLFLLLFPFAPLPPHRDLASRFFRLRLRRISNVYQRCRHGCREGWGKEGASISFSPSLSLSSTTVYIKIIVQGWCRFRSPVSPRDSLSFPPRISIFFFTFIVIRIRRDWRSLMDVFDSETVSIFDSLIQIDLYRKRLYLLKSKIDVNRFLSIFINRRELKSRRSRLKYQAD